MEDPNRPVTGYPAPNPNGYNNAANQPPPPSGTAYPYAAANPPPPNAYYHHQNYQNNPHYQQNYQNNPYYPDADSIRRANCLRRIFAVIIGFLVIFGTITFIVWLVLRPQLPEFRVDSFSISNFTLGNDSLISFGSEIGLTARNPNKKMTLSYDHVEADIFYDSDPISRTTVPPFEQETRTERSLVASFAAAGSFVERRVLNGISDDRSRRGGVVFNLRMISRVRFQAKAWRPRRRFLKVFCGDLMVGIPSNGRSGTLRGGPRQCRVGI